MSKLVCKNCGYANKSTMKFCINCGTKLEKEVELVENEGTENHFCEECGYKIEPGQVFCENCGNKLIKEDTHQEEIDEYVEKEEVTEEIPVEAEESEEIVEEEKEEIEEDEKRLCSNCGKELKSTQDFCPDCGTQAFNFPVELEKENSKNLDDEETSEIEEDKKEQNQEKEIEENDFAFCIECGKKLKKTQEFCPACGAKVMDENLDEIEEDTKEEDLKESSKIEETEESETEIEETEEEIEDAPLEIKEDLIVCESCGKKLKKGQDFCIHCGVKVKEVTNKSLEEPKKEKSNKKKILILLLLLLMIACGVACIVLKPWEKTNQKDNKKEEQKEVLVRVPSVINKNQKEAMEILEKLSLKVKIEESETEEEEKVGIVFEQKPVDKKVKKNSEVIIKVYISKEKVEMVPVVGDTLEDATKKLEAIGVAIKVIEKSSDTVEKGKVISQEVEDGKDVSKGSTVTITVSTGKEEEKKQEQNHNKNDGVVEKPTSTPKPTSTSKVTPTPKSTPTPKPNWSSWTASLPSNVNNSKYEIETKTQYRSRNKETTTSTNSSLSGWTQYDSKSEVVYSGNKVTTVDWNQYGSFKSNKNYQIISEEVITRDIHYAYCKMNNVYYSAPQATGNCPSGSDKVVMQQVSNRLLDTSIINTYVSKNIYDGAGSRQVLIVAMEPFTYKITYKEKTGEKNTYYFYKWDSWSSWQDNQISSNDNTQVETRTMYRYRTK